MSPIRSRVLAIDLGAKRAGVALSDAMGWLAQPLCTIQVTGVRQLIGEVQRLAGEHQVGRIVIGLPVNMDGTEGPKAEAARQFGARLAEESGLPVEWVDERLTTRMAQNVMLAADASRKKRKEKIDQVAAALILETWLTRHRSS
ncbi:MAG TPA: Holliday junction resolvase RuvX [Candidatus Xenobia bacterium]|jgi:putative Holliday junction resolvase